MASQVAPIRNGQSSVTTRAWVVQALGTRTGSSSREVAWMVLRWWWRTRWVAVAEEDGDVLGLVVAGDHQLDAVADCEAPRVGH